MKPTKACLPAAVSLLAVRDHSERELRRKLLRRYGAEEIDAAIAVLRARGYLNDDALTRRLAARYIEEGEHGRLGIRHRLEVRGLPSVSIDDALAGFDGDAEYDRAARLAGRRFADGSKAEAVKAGRFLASRGFSGETVMAVLRRMYDYN